MTTTENPLPFSKFSGIQTLIPQFDNQSAVTAQYFLDTLDNICVSATCTDQEKLLILKSRLRGDALSLVVNSIQLAKETNYSNFRKKFLELFQRTKSLTARQHQFSACRMIAGERVRNYAARVENATLQFLGDTDVTHTSVQAIYANAKLAKFTEGLLPQYKQALLSRDPQTFEEAVNFVELLQSNEAYASASDSINLLASANAPELQTLLDRHTQTTHEQIAALSNEIQKLRLGKDQPPVDSSRRSRYPNRRSFAPVPQPRDRQCSICRRTNHATNNCYFNRLRHPSSSRASNRGNFAQRNPPPRFQSRSPTPHRNNRTMFPPAGFRPATVRFDNSPYRGSKNAHRG